MKSVRTCRKREVWNIKRQDENEKSSGIRRMRRKEG